MALWAHNIVLKFQTLVYIFLYKSYIRITVPTFGWLIMRKLHRLNSP
jgi:hypothetical protein